MKRIKSFTEYLKEQYSSAREFPFGSIISIETEGFGPSKFYLKTFNGWEQIINPNQNGGKWTVEKYTNNIFSDQDINTMVSQSQAGILREGIKLNGVISSVLDYYSLPLGSIVTYEQPDGKVTLTKIDQTHWRKEESKNIHHQDYLPTDPSLEPTWLQ